MNTVTSVTFEESRLVESSLPLVFQGNGKPHSSAPFLSQALERTPMVQSPTGVPWAQQPAGPQGRPARSAHRGGCGLGWSLRSHVTAAIRAAGCGLPPSLLAAVTYRRPAPPTHPTRPHHDRYAHVTGPRGAAAPTPGKLREAREPNRRSLWLLTEPRCRAAASVSGIRGRPGGVGRARGAPGSHGALRVSCHGEQRAPCGNTGLRPCSGLCTEPIFRPQQPGAATWEPASAPGGPRCHLLQSVRP